MIDFINVIDGPHPTGSYSSFELTALYNPILVEITPFHSYHVYEKERADLRHKVDLIKAAESGKSYCQLANDFHIGRTQASSILKRKAELLLGYEQNSCYFTEPRLETSLF